MIIRRCFRISWNNDDQIVRRFFLGLFELLYLFIKSFVRDLHLNPGPLLINLTI